MKKIIILLITIYQKTLSKFLVSLFGNGCRFTPTCSEYAKKSFTDFGVVKGFALSLKRVSKCHPFSKAGHFDPVPESH